MNVQQVTFPEHALDGVSTPPGRVFWITGLSGSGKTTLGIELWKRLRSGGRPTLFLDGDTLRAVVSEDLTHTPASRRRSALRNARLCRLLASQGYDVVCATMSLFHEVQEWNRTNIPAYHEIYLRVPIEELERRDVKGIYREARAERLTNVVGLDIPAEFPREPDLLIDNHGTLDASAAVDRIWARCIASEPAWIDGRPAGEVRFGTKAETLERLRPALRSARVLPQVRCSAAEWGADRDSVLGRIEATDWGSRSVIVRSSSRSEDTASSSQAGKYESILNVQGRAQIAHAIDQVVASFSESIDGADQVFIQPMLQQTRLAGVAFSRRPDGGGPYFIINYDERSGRTDQVTSGVGDGLSIFFCLHSQSSRAPAQLAPVIALIEELRALLNDDALDIEFAVDVQGQLYLLQVRHLCVHGATAGLDKQTEEALGDIAQKVELLGRPHPYLHGTRTIFGVMPDWNPAEIVGLRPYPLSLSLYRELVTDAIWAYQRDNYGYQSLRSFPLLVSFHGLPYIDVRVSFNSFVPRDLSPDLSGRLVNYYIDCLRAEPHLHDKVEFEIIYSCYTLDLTQRLQKLSDHGFSEADRGELASALRGLTNRIIHGDTALWRRDREKIDLLAQRLPTICDSRIDKISRIYWLVEDCKRYGTLPFAGLARAGFIAVQLLRSFVSVGVFSDEDYTNFLGSVDTVGSRIGHDFATLPRAEFLARYGHLRPGTYDILSRRYDEAPDLYFDWNSARGPVPTRPRFTLSIEQLRDIERHLKKHCLEIDPISLMEFIKAGIEGREYAKFVFTRHLSDALALISQLGGEYGIPIEDCAYLDYEAIRSLYSRSGCVRQVLTDSIARGKQQHALTCNLVLPPLIASSEDIFAFHMPPSEPNFITHKMVTAAIASITDPPESFVGRILFIPSADPGYDWVFTRGISGFVTQFGGANSHMAIRAGELGIPAVIGAGEALYRRWSAHDKLCLDCGSQRVLALT